MNGARTASDGVLIAVDGVDAGALVKAARAALESRSRGGISKWDASGVFQELAVADSTAGAPSPRTLLLLYAADLAFRLRWQIRPALLEGRSVVAAPYVDTAIAFGRAAGLPLNWLANLFRFAPRAGARIVVPAGAAPATAAKDGFVGFASGHVNGGNDPRARQRLITQTAAILARTPPAPRRRRSPRARS